MKRFTFKLESVLGIKQKLENQARMEFSVAQMRLNAELEKLQELIDRRREYEAELKEAASGILDIQRIRSLHDAIDAMQEKITAQQMAVKRAENRVELERRKLQDAVLERKTIEKLKEKELEEYMREYNADEAAQVNELVSYRYGTGQNDD